METAAPAAAPATPAPPPAAAGGAAPAETAAAKPGEVKADQAPKHRVKIDGQEMEVTLEDLIRGYQTDAAGQKKLKEAADKEKLLSGEREKLTRAVTAAKSGDYAALVELGLTEDEIEALSVKVLSKKQQAVLEDERRKALDPKERELEDLRKEKEAREAKDKEAVAAEDKKKIDTATTTLRGHVIETLDVLPQDMRTGFFANRVLEAWEYAIENEQAISARGVKVTPQLIADKVRAEAVGLYGQILTRAKDEDLAALIPQEVVERLIKLRAAKPGEDPKPAAELHPALGGPTVRQGDKKPDEERPRRTEAEIKRSMVTRFT